MIKRLVASLSFFLSFAGFSGTFFWQVFQPDEMAFVNAISFDDIDKYIQVEDTVLGECLFIMELENLAYDDNNDWVSEILELNNCSRFIDIWNELKIHYSKPFESREVELGQTQFQGR